MEIARADALSPQLHTHALPNSQKEQKEYAKEGLSAEVETSTQKKELVEVSRVERAPQAPADSSSTDAHKPDDRNRVQKEAANNSNPANPTNSKPEGKKIVHFGAKESVQDSLPEQPAVAKDQQQPKEAQLFNKNGEVEGNKSQNSVVDVFV